MIYILKCTFTFIMLKCYFIIWCIRLSTNIIITSFINWSIKFILLLLFKLLLFRRWVCKSLLILILILILWIFLIIIYVLILFFFFRVWSIILRVTEILLLFFIIIIFALFSINIIYFIIILFYIFIYYIRLIHILTITRLLSSKYWIFSLHYIRRWNIIIYCWIWWNFTIIIVWNTSNSSNSWTLIFHIFILYYVWLILRIILWIILWINLWIILFYYWNIIKKIIIFYIIRYWCWWIRISSIQRYKSCTITYLIYIILLLYISFCYLFLFNNICLT
jgi:hypothetical protein